MISFINTVLDVILICKFKGKLLLLIVDQKKKKQKNRKTIHDQRCTGPLMLCRLTQGKV